MSEKIYTPPDSIFIDWHYYGGKYTMIQYNNGTYMLIAPTYTYIGLDVKKFDIKNHLVK